MNWKFCSVILCSLVVSYEAVKLPSYFDKCAKDDPNLNNCITVSGNKALQTLLDGDRKIHVVNLKPLVVPKIILNVGNNLRINMTNSSIYGLETAIFERTRWNFTTQRMDSVLSLHHAHLLGTYDIAGRLLILPINGHGPCNITYVKPKFTYFHEFEIKTKKNKKYYDVIKHGLTYETERAYFKMENLFNGDRRLGIEMNKFLDVNWREVNQELGARIGDALSEIFTGIIQEIYNRVPENELFLN